MHTLHGAFADRMGAAASPIVALSLIHILKLCAVKGGVVALGVQLFLFHRVGGVQIHQHKIGIEARLQLTLGKTQDLGDVYKRQGMSLSFTVKMQQLPGPGVLKV